MSLTIGIDLGTTNSAAAIFTTDGTVRMIETPEGEKTMPSAVSFDEDGSVWVGHPARAKLKRNDEFTFLHFKRLMGEPWNAEESLGDQTVEGDDGNIWLKGRERDYSPVELSSMVIRELLDCAEQRLGRRPDGAVITVPANATNEARADAIAAGKMAGLKRVSSIEEPVAASLAFGLRNRAYGQIAVYDLGGGTFDASVVKARDGFSDVIGKNGIGKLGGIDFDEVLVDHAVDDFNTSFGFDLMPFPEKMLRVREAAENVKIKLSTLPQFDFDVAMIHHESNQVYDLDTEITVELFEELTAPLIDRTIAACQRALEDAETSVDRIDEVLLVGGMTRMPAVRKAVEGYFGKISQTDFSPVEIVAAGASIEAARVDGRLADILKSRTSGSIGIHREGGAMYTVIEAGAGVPTVEDITITTAADNQPFASLHIVHGSDFMAENNRTLANVPIAIGQAPAGEPSIDLTFELDGARTLKVSRGPEILFQGAVDE